jgi:RNA polymerase sigma factor (sigma-70 family)
VGVLRSSGEVDSFVEWATLAEPRLRVALTALFGVQAAVDVTAEALAFAWERWGEVAVKKNPTGYVYGAARNIGRRDSRRAPVFVEVPEDRQRLVEPGLPSALARLSENQRIVVTLLHGHQWTMSEVADLLGVTKSTVQVHADRGLSALQSRLGVKA